MCLWFFRSQALLREFKDVKFEDKTLFRSLLKEICTLHKPTSIWTLKAEYQNAGSL